MYNPYNEIEQTIRYAIGPTNIEYRIDFAYGPTIMLKNRIGNSQDVPFSWMFQVSLNKGNIEIETNSWSGADFSTYDNIAYIQQCVDLFSTLLDVDWKSILEEIANFE